MGASGPLFKVPGGVQNPPGVNAPLPKGFARDNSAHPSRGVRASPRGLCLSQAWVPPRGSQVAPGVAAPPPDKAAGAQRAGAGRGLTGRRPSPWRRLGGGPLKGPRHRGHRAGHGHKGPRPRCSELQPHPGDLGPLTATRGCRLWGGTVGFPQLSCAASSPLPPPPRVSWLCHPRGAMCAPAIDSQFVWPPHIALPVLSPHGCCVTPQTLRVPPSQPWVSPLPAP